MFSRITSNQAILNGKPCIKGTRISIEFILELLSSGATFHDILKNYPHLTEEDLHEALQIDLNCEIYYYILSGER